MATTVGIAVLALLIGMAIGFLVFLIFRSEP
jgi:ABC-type amino acid transport system permease subunit